jgi:iron-sulfur cluster repair protein YtfE (RIC family)
MAERAVLGPSVAEALRADDEWLLALLRRAEDELARDDVQAAEQDFAELADRLERHMAVEEDVLYPAVERELGGPAGGGPTANLRSEHDEIRRWLEVIGDHLAAGGSFAAGELAILASRLAEHVCFEESLVYPTCDRVLDAPLRVRAARDLVRKGRGAS